MKKVKVCVSVLLSILIVSSCSSGNPTTPNRGNLTNLAKTPSTTPETELKRINISGRVIDSVTRKPVENASILLYVISSDEIIKKVKEGLKVPADASSASPSSGSSGSPAPEGTPDPNLGRSPDVVPVPDADPSISSPAPSASVLASPSSRPAPFEENEEVTASPSPNVKTSSSPSMINPKDLTNRSKDIGVPPKPAVVNSASPNPSGSPATGSTVDEKAVQEISEDLLSSALSSLKLNDIQEFEGKTGNDGKFWINKVPDTSIIITVNAPNYKTVSIFNLDTNKVEDIVIDPIQDKKELLPVYGSVYSAINTPINNASVSVSYPVGETFSIPVNSDTSGNFKTEDVKEGERTFLATVKEPSGLITSLGMLDYEIKKGAKATLAPKPVVVPSPVASKDPAKPEAITRDRSVPNIKMNAVTEYIDLKGKITNAKDNVLKSINVYATFKKKGLPKEEIFVTDKQIEAGSEEFSLSLPKLDSGYAYHLEFVAVNKKGTYIYHHENNIKKENKEMKVTFISPLSTGKVDYIEKEGEKLPIFSWTPVEAANFYKISIDRMDKDNNVTTVWEGITPFNTAVYPITTGSAKLNSANKYYWNVVAIKEGSVTPERINYSKLNVNTWTDLASSPNMEFSLSNDKEEQIEEIEIKKEG